MPPQDTGSTDRPRRTYAAVILVQALVLLALWATGRYFSSL